MGDKTRLETFDQDDLDDADRVAAEYRVTMKVLAVVVEQLLRYTEGEWVEISDTILADTPDLRAWRDEKGKRTIITVER